MSFCKYSTEFVASSKTEVDNIFINDYLPFAPSDYVKVYLYGLYKCNDSSAFDNNIASFSKHLNMSEDEIMEAFSYWQEEGLVQILSTSPVEIRYIPLNNVLTSNKLFKPDKYTTFNQQAQEIFEGKREISKTEYGEYYDFLERYHVEPEALLMIMRYCVDSKKSAVGYNYILTVAKNWANEGITTTQAVEERLQNFEQKDSDLQQVMDALSIKRLAYVEERALFNKWINDYGFNLDVVLHIAKKLKKKGKANFERIDSVLTKYYEMGLFSIMEIEDFEKEKEALYSLAKEINKTIGVYYESLDGEVENYILKWLNLGFDQNVLLDLAYYCFKKSIRTLEGMDKTLLKFHKLGILSSDALKEYMNEVLATDESIKKILTYLGLARNVNYIDRENFKTWKETWGFSDGVIVYACSLAKGKDSPLKYLGRVLSDWHNKGIKTIEEAKKTSPINEASMVARENFKGRSYSKEEINALFSSIDEVDV